MSETVAQFLCWVLISPFILLVGLWTLGVIASMFTPGPSVAQTARKYRKSFE